MVVIFVVYIFILTPIVHSFESVLLKSRIYGLTLNKLSSINIKVKQLFYITMK